MSTDLDFGALLGALLAIALAAYLGYALVRAEKF